KLRGLFCDDGCSLEPRPMTRTIPEPALLSSVFSAPHHEGRLNFRRVDLTCTQAPATSSSVESAQPGNSGLPGSRL
ncbi:hypothetical protein AVEN_259343-1, partial [Araneus ventricosus]